MREERRDPEQDGIEMEWESESENIVDLAAKRAQQVGRATDKPVFLSVRLPVKEMGSRIGIHYCWCATCTKLNSKPIVSS